MSQTAYIYDAIRTPRGIGKPGKGSLFEVKPIDLVTNLLEAMKTRNDLDTAQVDDVIIATGDPVNEQGSNLAKTALKHLETALKQPKTALNMALKIALIFKT